MNAGGRCADIAWAPTDPSQFAAAFSGAVLIFALDRSKEENLGGAGRPPVAEPRITISEPKTSKHNPRQRWCYYPALTNDEIVVLKQFQWIKALGDDQPCAPTAAGPCC